MQRNNLIMRWTYVSELSGDSCSRNEKLLRKDLQISNNVQCKNVINACCQQAYKDIHLCMICIRIKGFMSIREIKKSVDKINGGFFMVNKVTDFWENDIHVKIAQKRCTTKAIAATLLGSMLLLTGCSEEIEKLQNVKGYIEEKETSNVQDSVADIDTKTEQNNAVDIEYIGNAQLTHLTNFSEGRALVQYEDYSELSEGDVQDAVKALEGSDYDKVNYIMQHWDEMHGINRVALIDAKGKILWKSEFTMVDTALREVNGFKDGLAWFIFNGNEKSSYVIIDSDGNVTFTKDFTEDFLILGGGDGLFLTTEHIVNFNKNEWQIGVIDKNGNTVVPYKVYELNAPLQEPVYVEPPQDCSSEIEDICDAIEQLEMERQAWLEECWDYRGELDAEYYERTGAVEEEFQNQREELYEEKERIETEYQEQLEKYEEYQRELAEYEMERDYYIPRTISFDKHLTTYEVGDYRSCEYLGENVYKLNFIDSYVILDMNMQGICCLWDYRAATGFIADFESGATTTIYSEPTDMESNGQGVADYIELDFPEYEGSHEYAYSLFYNGYALMMVRGADGLPYFTIIDEEGNFMFDFKEGFEDAYISGDGKYLLALNGGSLTVFDVNGKPLTRIDTMNIRPDTGDYYEGYNVIGFDISEEMIRFGNRGCYVNVEDGTIIGSTFMNADDLSVTKY